ncbi:MAG: ribose/xylose/arabinose/galactoside ABC-type transport system permease subunit [Acidimicrobiales bacterium]|jgi:ribose/xylose/arabinose/galactoside ABC-type transport system permease subunit
MSDEQVSNAAAATTKMAADSHSGDERLAYRGVFQRILTRPEIGAGIAALGIWVFFWSVSVPFGKASGASSILDVASSPLGIMAVAVAMLMIGGEFDLSAGAATGALGVITILMVREVVGAPDGGWGLSLWLALPLSLLAALGLGWFNGTVVERTELPSFIVTLGSFFVLVGAKLGFSKLIVGQQQVGKLDDLQAITAYIDNGIVRIVDPDATDFVLPTGAEVFEVVPPVIDIIEENLASGAEAFGGLDPAVFESGDRGYGILVKVFAGEWTRNDHVWDGRDWFYTIGIVAGLSLFALALYEMQFRRSETKNPTGLALFVGGLALTVLGVWRLHATDSVAGNWIAALVIAAGMFVGFIGWGMWRYQSRASIQEAIGDIADQASGGADSPAVAGPLAFGLAAFVGAIVVASWLDPTDSEKFTASLGLSGLGVPIIALVVGVIAALLARGRDFNAIRMGALNKVPLQTLLGSSAIGFIITMLFFDITTEQGARAIFFLALSGLAAVLLIMAVGRGRRQSQALGSSLLVLTAATVTAMAFFVQSESSSPKFRTQAFTVMILIAALMTIWAVASMLFESRSAPDAGADRFGTMLGIIGGSLVVLGLTARLIFVTGDELRAEIPPATFSVRILWFLLFTAVCSWVLARTRFGSWTFAVGGNKQAARQVGVPAARTKTQLFMLVSAAAWLVGLLLAFRLNNIQANTGDGQEFQYIIAAVVGGTFLTGGYGSTIGAAIGAVIIAMSRQGIPSARWNSDWRFVFVGTILLLAVVANNFIRTKAEAAR